MDVLISETLKCFSFLGKVFAKPVVHLRSSNGLLKEVSAEEVKTLKAHLEEERVTYIPGSWMGYSSGGPPIEVHYKNNGIVRLKPVRYDKRGVRLYEIRTSRGSFKPPSKSLPNIYCLAYKPLVNSPSRVKYPLKRVDWSPENRNPQNRGKSGFVRISWDEALDIIVKELKRIRETYGLRSVLVQADGHGQSGYLHTPHMYGHYLFDKLGEGWIQQIRNPDSWEGWYWGAEHVWGFDLTQGRPPIADIQAEVLENAEMLICTGWDPETSTMGDFGWSSAIFAEWYRQAGIKLVAVSPDLNYSNAVHVDKWIPIRPNTDAALYLAIAYVWIKDGTYDKRFVETHCSGFEEFKKYVLGEEDGVPKTPKWAEEITGIPARTIKALAREWAKKRTSIMTFSGGPKIRGPYATEPARLEVLLLAMQGLGKPGRQYVDCIPRAFFTVIGSVPMYPEVMQMGCPRNYTVEYGECPPSPGAVPLIKTLVPEAVLNSSVNWYGWGSIVASRESQFVKMTFPPEGHPGIRMIWNENNCYVTCWKGNIVDAFREPKIEFIVVIHPWFENDALFADLVLPAKTIFETEDLGGCAASDIVALCYIEKCIETVGESKSDYEIHRMIAERLAKEFDKPELLEAFPSPEEWLKKAYNTSLAALRGISWEEFKKRGIVIYDSPTLEEWENIKREFDAKPGLRWYYELPEGGSLKTPTGKIEFYSKGLAENFPDDEERPPVPHYIPYGETHQESLMHPRSKKYPLLVNSPHPKWRKHAMGDSIPWLREEPIAKMKGPEGYLYEPVWIHPKDAAERGIKHGDIVKVYNERGTVLCAAYVTERTIPGSVRIDHGARFDPISLEDRIDRGGAINFICPEKLISKHVSGMVCSGFLVEVEKVDIFELAKKYPEAFKRKYNPDYGSYCESWVEG